MTSRETENQFQDVRISRSFKDRRIARTESRSFDLKDFKKSRVPACESLWRQGKKEEKKTSFSPNRFYIEQNEED